MNQERLACHGLRLLGSICFIVSGICLIAPTVLLGGMEIGLETPSALAEVRAAYGGSFGGLGALFWLGAQRPAQRARPRALHRSAATEPGDGRHTELARGRQSCSGGGGLRAGVRSLAGGIKGPR